MTKTKTYLYILGAVLTTIAIGYLLNIPIIKSATTQTFNYIQSPILPVIAAVFAFLFYGNKNYWFIITGCAVITAIILPFINGGQGASFFLVLYRSLAFMSVVYLMNLVKLIFNKV